MVALVGALGLVGGLGTQAYWTDAATVSGATITSGSLDLEVESQDSYTWTALSISDLAPGESTAESLTISNAGTTPFTVSIASEVSASSEAMRTAVLATVRSGGAASTVSATYPREEECAGTTTTYGPAALPVAPTPVLGPSDPIAPGGSLTFCVLLALDAAAGNPTQSQTYAPSFQVTATQAVP
ncbi:TasA family protein [Nocardioides ginkgobilobae]